MGHGPNAYRRASTATPRGRQCRPVLAGPGAVRAPLPAARRPFPRADAGDGAVAVPDRSRGHQAHLHSRHRRASPRSGVGEGLRAPSLPRPDGAHEHRRRRAHAQAAHAAPPVPRRRVERLPRDDAAQDRRGSRTLALRAPHSLPATHGSDQPRGDHGHGVRGHRPGARWAVALGDARAARARATRDGSSCRR